MRRILLTLVLLNFALRLPAQTNEPVKLALIAESDEASTASDVLTAQLSSNAKIHLLERNEIDKVYREQGLSADNKDYLKLGGVLGADGVLLLDKIITSSATNLTARLIAVKPGVVLLAENYSWPSTNTTDWGLAYAAHLDLFLPKLTLPAKEAIPLSVVNLRCATPSAEAPEVERQLRLLTIERLSEERQFFVLERQRMQPLAEEKDLKLDDSAFWNGSYLLDGVIDQNGYAKDTITINARLTPPKGGAPLLLEASGSRTNLAEVINQLAAKVEEALKANAMSPEWNAADESAQFFKEAQWAVRWGVFPEAEAAADSAWALGKQDLECAILRVRAYSLELSAEAGRFQLEDASISPGFNADGVAVGPPPTDAELQSRIQRTQREHPSGLTYKIEKQGALRIIHYVYADKPPDPRQIELAQHVLSLYEQFSRNSPEGAATVNAPGRNSDWYDAGVEALTAASQVLENFSLAPAYQKPAAEKLGELRALARSVAQRICESPSVHDSYYTGDRVVRYDDLYALSEKPNIFSCEVKWGCFWQERPADAIALYQQLMSSPAFCYIHLKFWFPETVDRPTPRLAAWNEEDQKSIPAIWDDFLRELNNSTNILLQLEAKALRFADTMDDNDIAATYNDFFAAFLENRCAMAQNNVDVLYLNWRADDLVRGKLETGASSTVRTQLEQQYQTDGLRQLAAKEKECRGETPPGQSNIAFEKQKQYLQANPPFDFQEFVKLFQFGFKDYSKAQALELRPLLAAYRSHLQMQVFDPAESRNARAGIAQLGLVETRVIYVLHPPQSSPAPQHPAQATPPAVAAKQPIAPAVFTQAPEIVSNVLTVGNFLEIPLGNLQSQDPNSVFGGAIITAHHWVEDKLLLDLKYGEFIQKADGIYQPSYPAIAILDPKKGHWDVIGCAPVKFEAENRLYHHSTICGGEIFTCNGNQIKKYDSTAQKWEILKISDGNNYELFTVNDRLYAANGNSVFEIINEGSGTRLLASGRRQPPASLLDGQELGTPTLCEGPGQSLRVVTPRKIFTWMGNDWREDSDAPSQGNPLPEDFVADGSTMFTERPPGILADGVLFAGPKVFRLGTQSDGVELCLERNAESAGQASFSPASASPLHSSPPTWKITLPVSLVRLPMTSRQSDLYCLADNSEARDIVDEQQHVIVGTEIRTKDGYHAKLLRFSAGQAEPLKTFLKFEALHGRPPAGTSAWMVASTKCLFFGVESPGWMFTPQDFPTKDGYVPGVWFLPLANLEPVAVEAKHAQQ